MKKIYNKKGKLVEVKLEKGEQMLLMKHNINSCSNSTPPILEVVESSFKDLKDASL